MANPKIPNQKNKYNQLNNRLAGYVALVRQIYDTLNLEAAKMAERVGYSGEKPFSFRDYPQLSDGVSKIQKKFVSDIGSLIYTGTTREWRESNLVQDLVADAVLKAYNATTSKKTYTKYYQTNSSHLKAFQERKDRGLNLSSKIWKQSVDYKEELESAISSAIEKGMSAVTLSKRISKYLNDFESLQKDYKGRFGTAVKCKDCEYASIRLARSEINMAYRTAEQKRWEQMDFVVGYEIKLSHAHHDRMPHGDICDELAGKYPKDFKWTGWHPNDMCYVIPILKTEDEFWAEDDAKSKNEVIDTPPKFNEWIVENSERITIAKHKGTLPYFIKDNKKYVEKITLDTLINDVLVRANEVKYEVQGLAESVAYKFGGGVTPINLKTFASIKRKVNSERISPYDLKDTVRTTIIVDKDKIDGVLKNLSDSDLFLRLKVQKPESFMGYSGNIVNIVTSKGVIGEIQVNTAKMIYAKEVPENAKRILGDELWNKISKEIGVEGGLGHKYYEEARILDPVNDFGKLSEIIEKSVQYYSKFQ